MKLTKGETTTAGSLPHEEVITMTPTKKMLEAFDEKFPNLGATDPKEGWYDAKPEVKSFLTSSIAQALAEEKKRMVKHVNKTLNRYVVKKEPLCEQNSLILLIRSHLLASLDKPLTGK